MNYSEETLLKIGSAALKKAAMNEQAKEYILSNPILFNTLKKAADRYIGGENLEETLKKVKTQNARQMKCSIEFMGENTSTSQEASEATDEFVNIAEAIGNDQLNSTISLDLSHIGLAISKDLCMENLNTICNHAVRANIEVTISAENVDRTDDVISIYQAVSQYHSNLAITLQAYLYRSDDDFKELIKIPGRIRIVKGAFETPANLSIPRGTELDQKYLSYIDQLLAQNHLCSIATHDKNMQDQAKRIIQKYKTPADKYEFESLYGIRNDQLFKLQAEGHSTKLYFVYGKEWYLYLCNRIAEYPLNIFQALADIVSGK